MGVDNLRFEIRLIEVGRNKRNKTFLSEENKSLEEEIILNAKEFLMSNNVWLQESSGSTEEVGVFNINAGVHSVGKAELRKIEDGK